MASARIKEQVLVELGCGPITGIDHQELMDQMGMSPDDVSKSQFKQAIGCLAYCTEHGPKITISRGPREHATSYEDRPYTLMLVDA